MSVGALNSVALLRLCCVNWLNLRYALMMLMQYQLQTRHLESRNNGIMEVEVRVPPALHCIELLFIPALTGFALPATGGIDGSGGSTTDRRGCTGWRIGGRRS